MDTKAEIKWDYRGDISEYFNERPSKNYPQKLTKAKVIRRWVIGARKSDRHYELRLQWDCDTRDEAKVFICESAGNKRGYLNVELSLSLSSQST